MPTLSHVLSFDEASRTSYARAHRGARDGRPRNRYEQEYDASRNRPSRASARDEHRSRAYDSPLSWDSLSLSSASAYRSGILRTAASESRRRNAYVYDSSEYAFERGSRAERSAGRSSERRYASPKTASRGTSGRLPSSRSTSGRLPSSRFAYEDDRADARSRRPASDDYARGSRRGDHDARGDERISRGKPTLIDRLKQKRHEYRKAKAGRQFAAQFQDAPSEASQNAPRAALYTGSLGTKQRQAMDLQHSPARSSSSARRSDGESRKPAWLDNLRSPKMLTIGIVTICLVATCAFIYPTARQYYQTVRQNAQLEAEYEAIQERNATLQQEVDSLQSAEGIHDRAHELYGWVAAGEYSVLVQGIERSTEGKTSGYQAAITPDSVPAPETWYSPVLDWFFGYDNTPTN